MPTHEIGATIYVCPKLNAWGDLRSDVLGVLSVSGTEADGFCLYYASREAYDKDWPDLEPLVFQVLRSMGEGSSTRQDFSDSSGTGGA